MTAPAPPATTGGRGRAWAARTKLAIALVGVGAFAAAAAAVPTTARGHTKHRLRPLAAPSDFVQVLKSDAASPGARVLPAASAGEPSSGTS